MLAANLTVTPGLQRPRANAELALFAAMEFRGTFWHTQSFLLTASDIVPEEAVMLFWPIVIALGPGFVALYYDHDVKSFDDQSACEQTLPELEQRARQAKEFMTAVGEAAGDQPSTITWQLTCIDKTPQEFQQHLEEQDD